MPKPRRASHRWDLPSGLIVKYYLTSNDALSGINELPNTYRNATAFNQTIWAKILNGSDCYGLVTANLVVNKLMPNNFQDETLYLCDNTSKYIQVDNVFSTYLWDDTLTSKTSKIKITSANSKGFVGCATPTMKPVLNGTDYTSVNTMHLS